VNALGQTETVTVVALIQRSLARVESSPHWQGFSRAEPGAAVKAQEARSFLAAPQAATLEDAERHFDAVAELVAALRVYESNRRRLPARLRDP